MNTGNLTAYLNDHLAGSVGALELLGHMRNDAPEDSFHEFCNSLYLEIEADQKVLEKLIVQLGGKKGLMKRTAAWLMEKAAWTGAKLGGSEKNEMGRLQALEGLELGIVGKRSLWVALTSIEHLAAALENVEFAHLIVRAEEQIHQVETERLKCISAVFS
jgi:hypothetical protein